MEKEEVVDKDLARNRIDMLNVYVPVDEPWIEEVERLTVENAVVGEVVVQRSSRMFLYKRNGFAVVMGKGTGSIKLWSGMRNDDGTPRIDYICDSELLEYPCYKIGNQEEVLKKLEEEMAK